MESDALRVVDDAIEDSVGVSRIADQLVPVFNRDLAGDYGGSLAVPFLEDLEQIVSCLGVERLEAEVVEDEELDGAQGA